MTKVDPQKYRSLLASDIDENSHSRLSSDYDKPSQSDDTECQLDQMLTPQPELEIKSQMSLPGGRRFNLEKLKKVASAQQFHVP